MCRSSRDALSEDAMRKTIMSSTLTALVLVISTAAYAERVTYTYDDAHRLIQADYGNGSVIAYAYDKSGNLLNRTVSSSAAAPVVTAAGVVNAASFKGGSV